MGTGSEKVFLIVNVYVIVLIQAKSWKFLIYNRRMKQLLITETY